MSERLPGYELLCKGGFGCSSLWLGQDHLLYIEGAGFLFPVHERYRRFRYEDIESVTVERNFVRPVGAVLLGLIEVVAAGCIVAMWSAGGERALIGDIGLGVLIATLLLAAILFLRNLSRGAACVGELVTQVSRVQPRPLRRWRAATAALPRLEDRVRVQRGDAEWTLNQTRDEDTPTLSGWSLLVCRMTGGISLGLSALLVAMIVLGLAGKVVAVLLSILALLAVSALLAALAAISRREVLIELRLSLWSLLVAFSVILGAGLVQFGVLAATRPDLATEMLAFAQLYGRVQDFSSDAVATFFLLLAGCGAVISVMIMMLARGSAGPDVAGERQASTSGDS